MTLLLVAGLLILVMVTIAAFVLFLIAAKAAVDARKKSDRGWPFHFALIAIWQALNVIWGILLSLEVWSML